MNYETRERREKGGGGSALGQSTVDPDSPVEVRVARVLSVGKLGDEEEAQQTDGAASGEDRLDQLEYLRRSTAEGLGYAYPQRLSRVLEVAEGP